MELIPNKYVNLYSWYLSCTRRLLLKFTSCDLCGQACSQHLLLCQHCFESLPKFEQTRVNGDLLNWPAINRALPNITFDHLICLAPYSSPLSDWLVQLKYLGRFEIANLLAELLSLHFLHIQRTAVKSLNDDIKITGIACVPLHMSKWQQRGYNQAHLIAKPFARLTNLPYFDQLLIRAKKTMSQVGQSGRLRRKNLKGAFTLNLPPKALPKHMLLIDDVVTTGATASEISRLLKGAGVEKVTVVSICLTLPS